MSFCKIIGWQNVVCKIVGCKRLMLAKCRLVKCRRFVFKERLFLRDLFNNKLLIFLLEAKSLYSINKVMKCNIWISITSYIRFLFTITKYIKVQVPFAFGSGDYHWFFDNADAPPPPPPPLSAWHTKNRDHPEGLKESVHQTPLGRLSKLFTLDSFSNETLFLPR